MRQDNQILLFKFENLDKNIYFLSFVQVILPKIKEKE
jgi:hypothetical protein